jgi:hypothetical protein
MSKFKVGDKVWFDKDTARKEGEKIAPHMCGWISSVPDGLLTISEFVFGSDRIIRVKECGDLIFSPDWLVGADEVKKTDKMEVKIREGRIEDVKFNGPATIVFWTDGTKTVVKCGKGDKFDPEKGIAMACAKKLLGNEEGYYKNLEKYLTKSKTASGGIESMKTEEIRSAVRAGCRLFPSIFDDCASRCPCRHTGGDGTCRTISVSSRNELIKMLKSFEKAGYFSYEDWRMSHA